MLTNFDSWAKPCPSPVSVNTVLLKHSHAYVAYIYCDRDHVSHKAYVPYLLFSLLEKKFVNLTKVSGKLHKRQTTVTAPGRGSPKGRVGKETSCSLMFIVFEF